ncbi:MAG: response regulator [Myxococcota bacterium]
MMATVLLIDDERLVLKQAAAALAREGLETVTTDEPGLPDGVRPERIDLVLLDVNMPHFFGDDLIPVLSELGVRAPVYLYSSLDEGRLRDIARSAGAAGVISKKLTFSQMADQVRTILGAPAP